MYIILTHAYLKVCVRGINILHIRILIFKKNIYFHKILVFKNIKNKNKNNNVFINDCKIYTLHINLNFYYEFLFGNI